jgi:hypothetical protein
MLNINIYNDFDKGLVAMSFDDWHQVLDELEKYGSLKYRNNQGPISVINLDNAKVSSVSRIK